MLLSVAFSSFGLEEQVDQLYSESHARKPTTRAWAIIRRPSATTGWPASAKVAPTATTLIAPVGPIAPADLSNPRSGGWWPMPADLTRPTNSTANKRVRAELRADLASHGRRRARGPPCTWDLILIRVLRQASFPQDRSTTWANGAPLETVAKVASQVRWKRRAGVGSR
jgi:hypothetical protein